MAGDNNSGQLQPLSVDSSGNVNANVVSAVLPSGAATAAKQDTGNASLASIDGKLPSGLTVSSTRLLVDGSGVTQPISAVSLPLPTGAASEATLSALSAKLPAALGAQLIAASLAVNIASNQTVPVSMAAVPTGGATAANQVTGNNSLASIDGKLGSLGQKAMAGSAPVVIASDQSAIPASQSGTWSTRTQDGSGNSISSTGNALDINLKTSSITLNVSAAQSGTWSSRTQDGSGNSLTSHAVNSNRGIDQYALGFTASEFVRNDYGSVNVTTAAYVQLIASTAAEYQEFEIFDSSGQTLKIAFGGAGVEVDKFIVYPGGNGRIKRNVPSGTRISIKAISATANAGEIDINLYG